MRILQLGKYYHPVKGGMETVLRQMCEGLLDRGHEVTALVAGVEATDSTEPLPGGITDCRGTLLRAGRLAVLNSQPIVPSLAALLRRELTQRPPDVVQVHLPNPIACAAVLALMGRQPASGRRPCLAIWYHADITRQRIGRWLLNPLLIRCLHRANGIAVSSEALKHHSQLLQRWRRQVRVIPFGIAPVGWETHERKASGPFLFVGRLVYYKGVSLLLEAVKQLPTAELIIVGDGPLQRSLREKARHDGLIGRVRFAGQLDEEGLRDCMRAARALVLPSVRASETFGLVQLEAMAAGLPVISSALPTGVSEVNRDGVTGRVVRPGHLGDLVAAMSEILDEPDQALAWGRAGRQRVLRSFTRDRMISRMEQWYEEIVAAGDGGAEADR